MRPNVEKNLLAWDRDYSWPEHGEEWAGQAAVCGVAYDVWKESLLRNLIEPNVSDRLHVLEIAPGHGRWTEHLAARSGHLTVVDLSPSCLSYCRERFAARGNIDYFLTTGDRLPRHAEDRVDFIWSFDSFVHMDQEVIGGYLREIRRVLKPGGTAIIHHSNVADPARHVQDGSPGWRSAMSAEIMRDLAGRAGLSVLSQFTYWDVQNRIGVPRHDDRITHLRRE